MVKQQNEIDKRLSNVKDLLEDSGFDVEVEGEAVVVSHWVLGELCRITFDPGSDEIPLPTRQLLVALKHALKIEREGLGIKIGADEVDIVKLSFRVRWGQSNDDGDEITSGWATRKITCYFRPGTTELIPKEEFLMIVAEKKAAKDRKIRLQGVLKFHQRGNKTTGTRILRCCYNQGA